MTIYLDDTPLADHVPAADGAEQQQAVALTAEDGGLDLRDVKRADWAHALWKYLIRLTSYLW